MHRYTGAQLHYSADTTSPPDGHGHKPPIGLADSSGCFRHLDRLPEQLIWKISLIAPCPHSTAAGAGGTSAPKVPAGTAMRPGAWVDSHSCDQLAKFRRAQVSRARLPVWGALARGIRPARCRAGQGHELEPGRRMRAPATVKIVADLVLCLHLSMFRALPDDGVTVANCNLS